MNAEPSATDASAPASTVGATLETTTAALAWALSPSASVTTTVTVYVPSSAYAWLAPAGDVAPGTTEGVGAVAPVDGHCVRVAAFGSLNWTLTATVDPSGAVAGTVSWSITGGPSVAMVKAFAALQSERLVPLAARTCQR